MVSYLAFNKLQFVKHHDPDFEFLDAWRQEQLMDFSEEDIDMDYS